MGSVVFEEIGQGSNAEDAFKNALNHSQGENGRGYSGSLAEKDDFVIIKDKPLSPEDAGTLAYKLLDECDIRVDDKWGPAGAIRLETETSIKQKWLFFGWASS